MPKQATNIIYCAILMFGRDEIIILFYVHRLLRFVFAYWANTMAKRKNRIDVFWGLLVFVIPGIGLLIQILLNGNKQFYFC